MYRTTSRLDNAFSVEVCARYQACLKTSHLLSAKQIIKYINGTREYGLLYTFDINNNLVVYCNIDSSEDHKSTLGGCFFLGNNLVSWFSKKHIISICQLLKLKMLQQGVVRLITIDETNVERIWCPSDAMTLYCDNMIVINISKNSI